MSASSATTVPAGFEANLGRRKVSGTIFYGACLAAIAILMLTLLLILVDVLVKGLPWLDWDFLTVVPVAAPDASRDPAGAHRLDRDRHPGRAVRLPGRGRRCDLPRRVRPRHATRTDSSRRTSATSPACRRSSTASSGSRCSSGSMSLGPTDPLGRADPDPAHPADRDHRQHRGAQGRAARRSARAPTRSAPRAGRWSAAASSRPPPPAS